MILFSVGSSYRDRIDIAPRLKLIGNSLILGLMQVIAEAYTLGDKADIDTAVIFDLIKELMPAPPYVL